MTKFILGKDILETFIDDPFNDGEIVICNSLLENVEFISKEELYKILDKINLLDNKISKIKLIKEELEK